MLLGWRPLQSFADGLVSAAEVHDSLQHKPEGVADEEFKAQRKSWQFEIT